MACRYLRLAEMSVGQLTPQSGRCARSDDRQTAKLIKRITVTTSLAKALSFMDRVSPALFD
jgi:hypothetical protein